MLFCKVICNFFIAPALIVLFKNITYHLCGRLVNIKFHCFAVGHNVTIRHGTYPFAFFLTAFYY